jgi:hypothetical protein
MFRIVVTIEYKSRTSVSERNIQPIGVYASSGYWYCPAYCFLREEIRQFRADRILSTLLNGSFPCREDVNQMTLMNKPKKDHLEQTTLRLELTKKGVWQLESNPRFAPFIQRNVDGSGMAIVQIAVEDMNFYVDLIWQLGRDVNILGPSEAITFIKQKIESMRSSYLCGLLLPGHSIILTWSKPRRKKASIGVQTTDEGLILSYKVNGENVCDQVPIVHTHCHYRGSRPWLQCPKCHRRVGKVHLNGKHFLCRHCYNLAYIENSTKLATILHALLLAVKVF